MNRSSFLRRCAAVTVGAGAWFLEGCGGGSGGDESPRFHYSVTEIANVPIASFISAGRMVARNRQGYCIGYSDGEYGDAFVVSPDGAVTILPELDMYRSTQVYGINNAGKVVGTSFLDRGPVEQFGFVYDIPTGVTTRIDTMNSPRSINDADQVVGLDFRNTSDPATTYGRGIVTNLATGATERLPDPDGDTYFLGTSINNSGLVAGSISNVLALYDVNTKTLRTVPPEIYPNSYPLSLSDSGKVIGIESNGTYYYPVTKDVATIPPPLSRTFTFDTISGVRTYLPELPRPETGGAGIFSLNATGDGVAGTSYGGYVFRQGRIQEINSTLSANDQKTWHIWEPFAMDDSGIIYTTGDLRDGTTASMPTYLLRLTPQ